MADEHTGHDPLLVAALAAGDLETDDLAGAEALVAACGECAQLATDLRAISRATADMLPARRPRDFFVRPADAERLRPHGLRRLVGALAGPRVRLVRPLAGGLMMIGFAGLLVAALPGISQLGASSSADRLIELNASPVPGSDIQGLPAAPVASGEPHATDVAFGGALGAANQGASAAPTVAPDTLETAREKVGDGVAGPSALAIGSVGLVGIGAALLLVSLLRPGPRRS